MKLSTIKMCERLLDEESDRLHQKMADRAQELVGIFGKNAKIDADYQYAKLREEFCNCMKSLKDIRSYEWK